MVAKGKNGADHPLYIDMIKSAISTLKDRKGSSRQAIVKYVTENYKVGDNVATCVKMTLKRNVVSGRLIQTKGTGASGSFKLAAQEKKPAKKAVTKKPAAKKTVAKKPVAKKPATKKLATKKPASKKSPAKKAKKSPAKKAAGKKTPKKTAKKRTPSKGKKGGRKSKK